MLYPKALGAYSVYRTAGDLVFLSGQLGLNPNTNELSSDDIKSQTKQALKNIKAILAELNLNEKHIVKATIFLSDINDFTLMNEEYEAFFEKPYPARSAFAVKALPKAAKVEIEVIASKKL